MTKVVYCQACGSTRFLTHVDGCEVWFFEITRPGPGPALVEADSNEVARAEAVHGAR